MSKTGEALILQQMERELPAELGVNLPEGVIYHYTDAFGLEGIIRTKKIWATHYRFQNDRRELKEGEDLVRGVAAELLAEQAPTGLRRLVLDAFLGNYDTMAVTQIVRDLFIASFSSVRDDLGQWRAYGGRGGGYCIGVKMQLSKSTEAVRVLEEQLGATFLKATYDLEAARAEFRRDLLKTTDGLIRYVTTYGTQADPGEMEKTAMLAAYRHAGTLAVRLKNPGFESEREWRYVAMPGANSPASMVKVRPTPLGLVPYIEIPLEPDREGPLVIEELIVGPTQDEKRGVHAAKLLLESHGHTRETADRVVVASQIPFRG